jgi:hypothetical protein
MQCVVLRQRDCQKKWVLVLFRTKESLNREETTLHRLLAVAETR